MTKEKDTKESVGDVHEYQTIRNTVGAYSWLTQFVQSLRSNEGVFVPCGECNACCRAFDAVRTNDGKFLMSLTDGRCSMLQSEKCSIYSDRPRTCQYYDCRTHFFSGVDPGNPIISHAIKGWRVTSSTPEDVAVVSIIKTIAAAISKGGTQQEYIAVHACILAYDLIHKNKFETNSKSQIEDE